MAKLLAWIKKWFWEKPVEVKKEPPAKIPATEVAHAYVVIDYHGQKINLRKTEVSLFNAMSRKDKRAMA